METTMNHIETLVSKAGELADTKAEMLKLKAVGKISETVSSLIVSISIVLCIVLAITIISFGAALWIGYAMGNVSKGFFIVGAFYLVAGIFVYLFRKTWIKIPLNNLLIDKLIKD